MERILRVKQILASAMLVLLIAASLADSATATQANSTNYGVNEVQFGTGGELHACSATYCAKQTAGELTAGNTKPATVTLNASPTADAYVNSSSTGTNYGSANPLNVSSSQYRSLLKFNTSAITNTSQISSVTLRLYSTDSQGGSYVVHPETDGWTESGVTWANQPAWNNAIIGTSAVATASTYVDIPLAVSTVTTGGNTNYGVDYNATSAVAHFASREDGTNPPKLVINYAGGNNQAQAGNNTSRDPLLEVSVSSTPVSLGNLTATSTASGSTTFSVRSYLASGYNVFVDGTSPRIKGGNVLTPMANAAQPTQGQEQFGINLRANTSPSVGADPVQVPDASFSFGAASVGYNTVNYFKYASGDTVATSTTSSGQTNYTMSMIANSSTITPAGTYGGRLFINVVPTF